MGDGRSALARKRDDDPATAAGFFDARNRRLLRRRMSRALRRPPIGRVALAGFRRERVHDALFPIASAMMEGGFVGVIADKVYHVHPSVLALIAAAPMFGNLSSGVWARLALGRRKVPLIVGIEALIALLVGAVVFLPEGAVGGGLLVAALIACRVLMSGFITIRSLVWTLNYPREGRARITMRLGMLTTLTIAATSFAGGLVLDATPESFRTVYGVGALLSLLGVLAISRVRIVDEREHLALERVVIDGVRSRGPSMLELLRHNTLYAEYQAWQFLLGASNMMIEATLVYLVSRELGASYAISIAITLTIPLALSLLGMPLWAAYLDRVHITEFRTRHTWLFVAGHLLTWIGAMLGSLLWIALARLVVGVARGGGMLAWNLGHNDFADRETVGLYMGLNVMLTGLRGAFAPFLGMLLYVGWSARELPGGLQLPGFDGIGGYVMLLSVALSTVATLGFTHLHRRTSRQR
jgi:MFS family permease